MINLRNILRGTALLALLYCLIVLQCSQERLYTSISHKSDNFASHNRTSSNLASHSPTSNSTMTKSTNVTSPELNTIREMMQHAWSSYASHAWGYDDLLPLSSRGLNWNNGSSLLFTPIDALDTLFLMNLTNEYTAAKNLVLTKLDFNAGGEREMANHFEVTIRILGGLLGAYELDPDPRYISKAVEIANRLLAAFDTETGFPLTWINIKTARPYRIYPMACLASIGTFQLEFQYLSDITGNPVYQEKALKVYKSLLETSLPIPDLYPIEVEVNRGFKVNPARYGIGADADSMYEYLLKFSISTNNTKILAMYRKSAGQIVTILKRVVGGRVIFPDLGDLNTMSHLGCFIGGMFTLAGMAYQDVGEASGYDSIDVGREVTASCWASYAALPHGLGGEHFSVNDETGNVLPTGQMILRPEVIESIFYQWRESHDVLYRDMGRAMIQNLNTHARIATGFHGLDGSNYAQKIDKMESFFLAETLKYLWLLFSDDNVVPLDQYVLNTEAHVLSVRGFGRRADPKKWVHFPKYWN